MYGLKTTINIYCLIVSVGQEFGSILGGWFWLSFSTRLQSRWPGLPETLPQWFTHMAGQLMLVVGGRPLSLSMCAPPTGLVRVLTFCETWRCEAGGHDAFL